jgi:TatD DNase family protein
MQLIDTHSHLYAEEFDADRNEALSRAREAGVERLLLPAIDSESHERLFALASEAPDMCRLMMGLHPTSVNDNPRWREELALVEQYLENPPEGVCFCAVGEIGLDYYWSQDFVAEQREAFVAQCRMASRLGLPVAIHTRSAWGDMCELLEQESAEARSRGEVLRGVLHAYSEDVDTYHRLLKCGDFLFGIGGVVTFKKSALAEVVAQMSLDDLLLETDCPYLTPAPHRGERNESSYTRFICEKIAALHNVEAEEVARRTTASAKRMFSL